MEPLLKHIWNKWRDITKELGRVQAAILLWIVYWTAVTLTALGMRISGSTAPQGWQDVSAIQDSLDEQY